MVLQAHLLVERTDDGSDGRKKRRPEKRGPGKGKTAGLAHTPAWPPAAGQPRFRMLEVLGLANRTPCPEAFLAGPASTRTLASLASGVKWHLGTRGALRIRQGGEHSRRCDSAADTVDLQVQNTGAQNTGDRFLDP